jgi:hypothetical protein
VCISSSIKTDICRRHSKVETKMFEAFEKPWTNSSITLWEGYRVRQGISYLESKSNHLSP